MSDGNTAMPPEQRYREDWPLLRRTLRLDDLVDTAMMADMIGISERSLKAHMKDMRGRPNFAKMLPTPVVQAEYRKPLFLRTEAEEFARRWDGVRQFRMRRRKGASKND